MHLPRQKWIERILLCLYLVGFLAMAVPMAMTQPLADTPPTFMNPPDEHSRYLVPLYICEHGTIPTGFEEEVRIPGYGTSYALYNVFPYIIQGIVMRLMQPLLTSAEGMLITARMVNVFFGLLMAAVVYLIGKRCFRDDRFRWLFCVAVTFLPQNIFVHTYVNTDSCCMLSTAMMVYALICCYQDEINYRNALWMCGGIILCALSYYNAYGYILSCIILFLVYFGRKKDGHFTYDWKKMLKMGTFISVIVLMGISWWFVHRFIVLDGDFLGLATREKMALEYAVESVNPLTFQTYQEMGYTVWEMMKERSFLDGVFCSFVAFFGSMSLPASMWFYRFFKIFFAAGVVGCIYYLWNRRERITYNARRIWFHGNMIFCAVMPFLLTVYYAYTMDYQPQGRYILPGLIPIMAYTVKGVQKLSQIHYKEYRFPRWLINTAITACFVAILAGTIDMVYLRALPAILEVGMVME